MLAFAIITLFLRTERLHHLASSFNENVGEHSEVHPEIDHFNGDGNKDSNIAMNAKIRIFYNLYIPSSGDEERVLNIMKEQFANMDPEIHDANVLIISIGHRPSKIVNESILEHFNEGNEDRTLHALWKYCRASNNRHVRVVYLHSKGSFHPNEANNLLRRFLTEGALSQECAILPDTCNVCSSRMSPLPHPPGNMWLARCDYVATLVDPYTLREGKLARDYNVNNPCRGFGRFFFEHWIHSHPSVMPCDLYSGKEYKWGYDGIPIGDFEKDQKKAPRFAFNDYVGKGCLSSRTQYVRNIFWHYEQLYNVTNLDESWWGWTFFGF